MARTATRIIVYAKGDLRVEDGPLPAAAPDEAIVRVEYGGVCGSDLHYWLDGAAGQSILRDPLILGHEVAGTVELAAADGSGPTVGTAVTVHPGSPKGDATRYPPDRPNLSPLGTYLGSAATIPHTNGAFATRVVLPTRMLRPLPAGVDTKMAVLAEPSGVALHAVRRAGEVRGRRALVVGCGPIGALIVACLRRAGAGEVVAVDVHRSALQRAVGLGADHGLLATDPTVAEVNADIVFEVTGNQRGLASALAGTSRGGRVVMVGLLPPGDQPVAISLAISRELELVGSFRFVDEIDEALDAMADGSLHLTDVVTHVFTAADALEAFTVARDAAKSCKVLLDFRALD